MSDTPETDALDNELSDYDWDEGYGKLLERTRKLERERDEARKEADKQTEIANAMTEYMGDEAALIKERDQLRKVVDELAVFRLLYNNNRGIYETVGLESFYSLPHVIERNKSK